MRRLRKYLALSPAGRAIVLRSLLLLPMVAVLLRARGMARTTKFLARPGRHAGGGLGTPAPQELARLVNAAAAPLRVRCLPRSLVLWRFLRHSGTPAEIRLGVSKLADGSLSAHAWIELDGMPLGDGPDVFERYACLNSTTAGFQADRP